MAERFQRGLRNLINTPPKPRKPAAPKAKERPPSKGHSHKRSAKLTVQFFRKSRLARS